MSNYNSKKYSLPQILVAKGLDRQIHEGATELLAQGQKPQNGTLKYNEENRLSFVQSPTSTFYTSVSMADSLS